MSILINKDTKVITQGITGKTGQFHTRMCRDYANGKNCFVAGVNPKKAGDHHDNEEEEEGYGGGALRGNPPAWQLGSQRMRYDQLSRDI